MSSPKRWKMKGKAELQRLASDSSWCLPSFGANDSGSSSSLCRSTRATELKRRAEVSPSIIIPGEVSTAVSSNMSTLTASNGAVDTPKKDRAIPSHSRVLMDVDLLKDTLEEHVLCPLCKTKVYVSFPTVCLASSIRIQCDNPICTFVEVNKPTSSAAPQLGENASPNIERNTDYAVNILYVLGFLTSGDGGKEASKVMGLLGLPRSKTMEKRSWPKIEKAISPAIRAVTEEIMEENLHMAVENYYGDRTDEDGVSLFQRWKEHSLLEDDEKPHIKVGADMGWQGRSSGILFSSASGHSMLVEQETRLVVALDIKSKICNVCSWHADNDQPVRQHECVKNHEGSSGSMEPLSILDMVVRLYDDKAVITDTIVTDDDSSIKAKLKWNNEDYMKNHNTTVRPTHTTKGGNVVPRPDRGNLPCYIPEPKFLADPNHRKKTLKGVLYGILKRRIKERHGLTKVDVIRLVNNFAYMIRGLWKLPSPDDYVPAGKAVLEHHFDNHEYCSETFCKRKSMTQAEKDAEDKIYRCKTKDAELYKFLQSDVLPRFLTKHALHEVAHSMDTQVNESLNNSIAWLAPKNKTYSGSISLRNRVCVAIGISSIGTLHYFRRIFEALDIKMTPDVEHYLVLHGEARDYRITKAQDTESKRLRNSKLHGKLKKASVELKGILATRDGAVYQPGIGLDGGYTSGDAADGDNQAGTGGLKTPPAKRRKTSTAARKCSACGESGHNRSNRMCRLWKPRGAVDGSGAATGRDLDEQNLLDQMAFAADQDVDEAVGSGLLSAIL